VPRYQIRIVNEPDRTEQLRRAYRVRDDLIEHAQVWVDPERPLQGVHRDGEGRAYFELAADHGETISDVLNREGHTAYTALNETKDCLGDPCQQCGNIAGPIQPPACPNCGFLDIAQCPVCHQLYPRREYERIGRSNLFYCPTRQPDGLRHRVRLIFNEPVILPNGRFNQPLILVQDAVQRRCALGSIST